MAKKKSSAAAKSSDELLTLSEVSNRTKISMPTLQRYKKLFQDRIPSVGEGRRQRYPVEALEVFEEIKKENVARRGRPRSAEKKGRAAKSSRKPPARRRKTKKQAQAKREASSSDSELLTLSRIGELTGISYPTLARYVKLHGRQIPSEGTGRRRRYYPEAVEVFRELRSQSRRGGARKSSGRKTSPGRKMGSGSSSSSSSDKALLKRIATLEKANAKLEKRLDRIVKKLNRPLKLV